MTYPSPPPGALGQGWVAPPSDAVGRAGPLGRAVGFLRAHPVVALLILTPGIPEYLSGSSSMAGLVVAPPLFLLFLALNLGLYGPGVLLIREAMVRWKKGWGTVILLGAAYAVLEEGLALSTFFNPDASVVGALGFYGHFAGVSWVWVAGLLMVHIVFSIALPILLLGLAIPETRGRSLLTDREIRLAVVVLVADVGLLFAIVLGGERFWMGWPLLLSSLATIAGLVGLGRVVPAGLLAPRVGPPSAAPWVLATVGVLLFPGTLLLEALGGWLRAWPGWVIAALAGFYASELWLARRWLGDRNDAAHQVAFAAGVVGFVAFVGLVSSLALPVVLVADAAFAYLFTRLWRRYRPAVGSLRRAGAAPAA